MTINPLTPKVSEAEKRFFARTFNSDLVTEFVIQALNDIYDNPSKDSANSSPTTTRSSDNQDFWSDFELESSSPQNEPAVQKQPAKSVYGTARTSSKIQELVADLESYNQTKGPEEIPVIVAQENLKPADVINDNLAKVKSAVQIAAQQGLTSFNSFKGSVTSVLNKFKQ